MAFSSSDLDAVNAAIASGELSVEVAGRKVVYRTISDLIAAADRIKAELAAQNAVTGTGRRGAYRVTFQTHRGY